MTLSGLLQHCRQSVQNLFGLHTFIYDHVAQYRRNVDSIDRTNASLSTLLRTSWTCHSTVCASISQVVCIPPVFTLKPCRVTHICCMYCLSCSLVVKECELRSSTLCATCMNTWAITFTWREYYRRTSVPKSRFRLCVSANEGASSELTTAPANLLQKLVGSRQLWFVQKATQILTKWRRSRASVCCVATWVVFVWSKLPEEYNEVCKTCEHFGIDRVQEEE